MAMTCMWSLLTHLFFGGTRSGHLLLLTPLRPRFSILTISVWGQHLWMPERSQIVEHAVLVYLFAGQPDQLVKFSLQPTDALSPVSVSWHFLRFLLALAPTLAPAPAVGKATSDGKQCQESCSCFRSCSCSWKRVRPQKRMARHSIHSLITLEENVLIVIILYYIDIYC